MFVLSTGAVSRAAPWTDGRSVSGLVGGDRFSGGRPPHRGKTDMGIQGTEDGREPASSADQSRMRDGVAGGEGIDRAEGLDGAQGPGRPGPLRVDAQRNLRLV